VFRGGEENLLKGIGAKALIPSWCNKRESQSPSNQKKRKAKVLEWRNRSWSYPISKFLFFPNSTKIPPQIL